MIPIGMLPCIQIVPDIPALCMPIAMLPLALLGLIFAIPAYNLYKTMEMKYAKQIMFASFIYLPIVQLMYYFFKI
jgi:protoheme IX farnesyltransferase